mmetsp:Transcript_118119/g.329339  ORF Transcript_118119/g.329339 Transcript_118119/m.329339 type:complete len:212 (-) Transcript_118119:304-939(-)
MAWIMLWVSGFGSTYGPKCAGFCATAWMTCCWKDVVPAAVQSMEGASCSSVVTAPPVKGLWCGFRAKVFRGCVALRVTPGRNISSFRMIRGDAAATGDPTGAAATTVVFAATGWAGIKAERFTEVAGTPDDTTVVVCAGAVWAMVVICTGDVCTVAAGAMATTGTDSATTAGALYTAGEGLAQRIEVAGLTVGCAPKAGNCCASEMDTDAT